jgi:hypothetical protein
MIFRQMKMKNIMLGALALMLVGCAATKEYPYNAVRVGEEGSDALRVNLEPVMAAQAKMPELTVGTGSFEHGLANVGLGKSLTANVPLLAVDVPVPSLTVGPEKLNAKVGVENSVTVGSLTVGQNLPSIGFGTDVNHEKVFDFTLKGGVGIILPFVSVYVPWPTLDTGEEPKEEPKE